MSGPADEGDQPLHPADLKAYARELAVSEGAYEHARIEFATALLALLDAGVPKASALDYLAVRVLGIPMDEWVSRRAVTRDTAVKQNIERAEDRLDEPLVGDPDDVEDELAHRAAFPTAEDITAMAAKLQRAPRQSAVLRRLDDLEYAQSRDIRAPMDVKAQAVDSALRALRSRGLVGTVEVETNTYQVYELTPFGKAVADRLDGA